MNRTVRVIFIGTMALGLASIARAHSPTLTGVCSGWPSPRVVLSWDLPWHRDSNNIEKGPHPNYVTDTTGNVPFFGFIADDGNGSQNWGQAGVGWNQTSYTDSNISAGTTYRWRIKSHATGANSRSNNLDIAINSCNCGGGCPAADNAWVMVNAVPTTVNTNQQFTAIFSVFNIGASTWSFPAYSLQTTDASNTTFWSAPLSPIFYYIPSILVPPFGWFQTTLTVTAPPVAGTYYIHPWRMRSGTGFFGSASPMAQVIVVAPNQPATGQIETVACTGISGWAKDPDAATARWVVMYRDGPMGVGPLVAGFWSNAAHASPYNGYGFSWPPLVDGISHTYYLYVQDLQNSVWYPLVGSPTAGLACSPPPPTVTLSAVPSTVANGGTSTLTWSSTNAVSCTASGGWSGTKSTPGGSELSGALASTTTFRLTCANSVGVTATASAVVTVLAPPTVTLSAAPTSVLNGGTTTLTWSSTNAVTCTASGGWLGGKSIVGSEVSGPLTTTPATTFTLTCFNALGTSAVASVAVNVSAAFPNYREVRPGGTR